MKDGIVRFGVVGLRNVGQGHLRAARAVAGASVVAVADTDASRLEAVRKEHGVPRAYPSAEDLFRDDDLDAVILAVPNHLHEPLTVAALEAGKHVLVEKPIARTTVEAGRMMAARDKTGRMLMVGMNQRFGPVNAAIRAAIAEGALGAFQTGRTGWTCYRVHEGLWGRGDWFLSAARAGGGPLLDLGIHRLDLALYFLGFPAVAGVTGTVFRGIGREVAARKGLRYEVEDGAVGQVRFADGSSLVVEASYFQNTNDAGQFTLLCGDRGCLNAGKEAKLFRCDGPEPVEVPLRPVAGSARSCVEHFTRVLRGEEALSPTAEQARTGLAIVEAMYGQKGG